MARGNYLIKVGNYEIPLSVMKFDSYSCTYETLDLDSYRDANGLLHRNALSHRCSKVEFETPNMYESELMAFMDNIRANYLSSQEQSFNARIYVPELNDYVEQKVYMVNTAFKVAQNSNEGLIYQPVRVAFIAY